MQFMDKYKIQASIDDSISILDSAPIRIDLIEELNIVQLANRILIAHLATERGLKALIKQSRPYEEVHSLSKLYKDLSECSTDYADFLSRAFCDAVEFYGYNVNFKGLRHFRSLQDYLSKVGGEEAFELIRYWAIGEKPSGENPLRLISPPIHRELLCALSCLFLRNSRQTVSDRVEAAVNHAMFLGRHLGWSKDDIEKRDSVNWYQNWLYNEHPNCRSALLVAYRNNFVVKKEDEFITQTLLNAFNELRQSKDPAVQYYATKCSYLPKGSQQRHRDATPVVELNERKNRGTVETPAGTCLGLINRYADGAWGITPVEAGSGGVVDVAEAQADAKWYLVNRLTSKATVTVNGAARKLRIVGKPQIPADSEWTSDSETVLKQMTRGTTIKLEFWDGNHSLQPGDEVAIEVPSKEFPTIASCYEGSMASVEGQNVTIEGNEYLKERCENP